MTPRQLVRAALLLVVLLLLWGGIQLLRRSRRDKPVGIQLPVVKASEAESILIVRPADTVRLVRSGESWTVNGYAAAPTAVSDFFKALADTAAASELVAENSSSHARLGVDSTAGLRLRILSAGQPRLDLIVGSHGPDFEGYYVRHPGDARVYLLHGDFPSLADRRESDWREHTIAGAQPDSVARIDILRGRANYTLLRGKGWAFANGTPADSGAVGRLLEAYRTVKASGFPSRAQLDSVKFLRPVRRARLADAKGIPRLTLAFDSTASGLWVRVDTAKAFYRMDSWVADELVPADSALKPKAARGKR